MKEELQFIFKLEDSESFNEAYKLYKSLLLKSNFDFEIWKFYFFFLWSMIEDVECKFTLIGNYENLRLELENELTFGLKNFEAIAEFNFIVGYAISIFPYEFGDYKELEILATKMLLKATQLKPENEIYKMVYLGNQSGINKKEYEQSIKKASEKVLEKYSGEGLMNNYFKSVLYRLK